MADIALKRRLPLTLKFAEPYIQMGIQIGSAASAFVLFQILAARLGASVQSDALTTAYSLVGHASVLIFTLVSMTWIPLFVRYTAANDAEASPNGLSAILYGTFAVAGAIYILGFVLAEEIIAVTAAGMSDEGQAIATQLFRVLLLLFVFQAVAGVVSGIVNVRGRFLLAASGSLITNLGAIAVVCIFPATNVQTVAMGWVAGALFFAATLWIQCWPDLRRLLSTMPRIDATARDFLVTALPLMIQTCIVLTETGLARRYFTVAGVGISTVLTLAMNVRNPLIVALRQLVVRAYPGLAQHAATGQDPQFARAIEAVTRRILLIGLPLTCLLATMSGPICHVLYQRGAFDADATHKTAVALALYVLVLVLYAIDNVFDRVFLILRKPSLLPILSAAALGAFVTVAPMGLYYWGYAGLVVAQNADVVVKCGIAAILVSRMTHFSLRRLGFDVFVLIPGLAAMWLVCHFLTASLLDVSGVNTVGLLSRMALIAILALAAYVAATVCTRNPRALVNPLEAWRSFQNQLDGQRVDAESR